MKDLQQHILNGTGGLRALPDLRVVDASLAEYTLSDDHEAVWQVLFAQMQVERASHALSTKKVDVPPCPAEKAGFCTSAAALLLIDLIESREWKVLHEALRILTFLKKRMHPLALPAVLSNLGARYDIYPYLVATVGERFRWLAALSESWAHWLTLEERASHTRGLNWAAYIWQSAQDISHTNLNLAQMAGHLSTTEKIKICDWAMQHPHVSFQQLLPELLPSRSKILRRKVLNATLQLPQHQYQSEINDFAQTYMSRAWSIHGGKWKFRPDKSALVNGVSFKLSEVGHYADYFTNPRMRILALADPQFLLPGPMSDELIALLLEDVSLERPAQIIICSLGHHHPSKESERVLKHYLRIYPKGNTVALRIDPLVPVLDTDQFRRQVDDLLNHAKGRFFEKLRMLLVEDSPYISRSHSESIVDRIVEGLTYELSHHEMMNLDRLLPLLAYKLDSRIQPKLRTLWSEELTYYGALRKSLPFFQKILERRHQILEAITLGA